MDYENASYKNALVEYAGQDGAAFSDYEAFKKMMQTVTQLHDNGDITKDDIKNPELYTTGAVAEYFNSYVSFAQLSNNLTDEQIVQLKSALDNNAGSIAVYITAGDIGCSENELCNN